MNTERVEFRATREQLAEIEKARGLTARAAWVRDAVLKAAAFENLRKAADVMGERQRTA